VLSLTGRNNGCMLRFRKCHKQKSKFPVGPNDFVPQTEVSTLILTWNAAAFQDASKDGLSFHGSGLIEIRKFHQFCMLCWWQFSHHERFCSFFSFFLPHTIASQFVGGKDYKLIPSKKATKPLARWILTISSAQVTSNEIAQAIAKLVRIIEW